MHRHTGPAPSIMVWGGIGYHSRTRLVRIAGTLNSQSYISKVLEKVVLPYLQGLATAIFQQDNARPHVARIVQRFFVNHQIELLPWLARSPDLSPMENMWSMVASRLIQISPPSCHSRLTVAAYKKNGGRHPISRYRSKNNSISGIDKKNGGRHPISLNHKKNGGRHLISLNHKKNGGRHPISLNRSKNNSISGIDKKNGGRHPISLNRSKNNSIAGIDKNNGGRHPISRHRSKNNSSAGVGSRNISSTRKVVPSHVGLPGNEVADYLAKAATSDPVDPEDHMVLTSTEIYSRAKEFICRAWVVPPVHPLYFKGRPGSAISFKVSRSYQTTFS
ncbi:transposable element Tcb1 transposase [Trichonephila clavipes]|uniref:Transposable element Tcb1 transposase n=1 Tax=Trichonephila clavipes TaxID=2585209 RepID=A0A8X6W6V1_TRICX|nr:transposable element Tcb1 transposase [Trichonephila clavipes]